MATACQLTLQGLAFVRDHLFLSSAVTGRLSLAAVDVLLACSAILSPATRCSEHATRRVLGITINLARQSEDGLRVPLGLTSYVAVPLIIL